MRIQVAAMDHVPRNFISEIMEFEQKRLEKRFIKNNPGYIPGIISRRMVCKENGEYWVEMEVETAFKVNKDIEI